MAAGWACMNDMIVIQASQVGHRSSLLNSNTQTGTGIAGTMRICSAECPRCGVARRGRWTRSPTQLRAVRTADGGSLPIQWREGVPAQGPCTHPHVRARIRRSVECSTHTRCPSVPFSVKRLNAACGVMITGTTFNQVCLRN